MSDKSLRIIFAGTPDFAAASLAALLEKKFNIVAVYTQPDRPAGRGRKLKPSPVKALALEHELPVEQPVSLRNEEAQATLAAYNADLMIVVAYGLLLPKAVLDTPRLGCINVHGSLLPRWRGAAPIQRALLAGDDETGVTLMQMDVGLDTGDMLTKASCPITADDTSATLHDRLADLGAKLLCDSLPALAAGEITPQPQDDSLSCYAEKLSKEEGDLDWTQPAADLARLIRGLNPWPVAYTSQHGDKIRLWHAHLGNDTTTAAPGTIVAASRDGIEVATGKGTLILDQLQLPGKKAMAVRDLLNSPANAERFAVSTRLGDLGE